MLLRLSFRHIIISLYITIITQIINVLSIDCFKCVSYNGGNKACDDPFHNNHSTTILESPCMGGRKGRDGLFPATACIKIAGYYDDTGETITVRGCALDSGTLTTDTEIIRMSHCGKFYYDDRYVHGCLQSCSDADACNTAASSIIKNIRLYHQSPIGNQLMLTIHQHFMMLLLTAIISVINKRYRGYSFVRLR